MLQSLRRFLSLCTAQDVRRLWVLLLMVVGTGILEVAGIASILPFLQLAADPEAASGNLLIQRIFDVLGLDTRSAGLLVIGWAVILFLGVSNLLTALASWHTQRIAWTIAHHVSVFLASSYANLPYQFYLHKESGDIIKSVIDDVNRLVDGVVIAGCRLITQFIVSAMILVLILIIDAWIAVIAICVFFGPYLVMTYLRKAYLTDLGRERILANSQRFVTFSDLIVGIKAIKSAGANEYFVNRFEAPSKTFSLIQPKIHISSVLPRYVLESIAFSSVVFVIMYLSNRSMDLVAVLPTLTLFTLAGYRLMPAAHLGYQSVVQLLSNYPAIDNIYRDVHSHSSPAAGIAVFAPPDAVGKPNVQQAAASGVSKCATRFNDSLSLHDLSFTYGNNNPDVLSDISLRINKGQKIGFVGPSGSGKTTLIDILVGLLHPTDGQIQLDGVHIDSNKTEILKTLTGYVPQDVFLYNDSVARNVAFGKNEIDLERVKRSCSIAQMDSVIENEFTAGYSTVIGDRGLRLSGGQRQRIGLARALYQQPEILVLDEATSALDTLTEKSVLTEILNKLPDITIIMIAHRLSTVRDCDKLFVLDRGRLIAEGTYDHLISSSRLFREMASIS